MTGEVRMRPSRDQPDQTHGDDLMDFLGQDYRQSLDDPILPIGTGLLQFETRLLFPTLHQKTD